MSDMRLASASEDGTVRIWDVQNGHILHTLDLAHPIAHMTCLSSDSLLCFTSNYLVLVTLRNRQQSKKSPFRRKILVEVLKSQNCRVAASSHSGLVAVTDNKAIHLTNLNTPDRIVTVKCRNCLTSIALSPDAACLAVGDEQGFISIYANPLDLLPNHSKRIFINNHSATLCNWHWHSGPVRALTFTHDGTMLLSGGSEAVLVSWRMTPSNFGTKSFLPRLRAPILAISVSPDQSTYALTQADNSVRLIQQTSGTVKATIRGVRAILMDYSHDNPSRDLSSRVSSQFVSAMSMIPDTKHKGHVWIAGGPSIIQRFDVYKGEHVEDMLIAPRNLIFEARKGNGKSNSQRQAQVAHVAMHSSGLRFASVEYQELDVEGSNDFRTESGITTLRFWKRRRLELPFELDAVIPQPFGFNSSISSICFHPTLPVLATASPSGSFKLWRATATVDGSQKFSWRSELEMSYKNLSCNSLYFSKDGSLIAVACGSVLALWVVNDLQSTVPSCLNEEDEKDYFVESTVAPASSCSLELDFLHALVHPPSEEEIQSISFVFDKVPLFIAATPNGVYVWNALTQGIWWSSRIRNVSKCLAVDEKSGRFAVIVKIPALACSGDDSHVNGKVIEKEEQVENDTENADVESTGEKSTEKEESADLSPKNLMKKRKGKLKGMEVENDETAGVPKRKRYFQATDNAVAIFNASSPLPLRVSRLPSGVDAAGLAFVPTHGSELSEPSPLVCIDSRMGVVFFTSEEVEDKMSFVSEASIIRADITETLKPSGKLNALLGDEWHESVIQRKERKVEKSLERSSGDGVMGFKDHGYKDNMSRVLANSFSETYDGPIHIQAPVSTKSFDFINSLLVCSDVKEEEANQSMPDPLEEPINEVKALTSDSVGNQNAELPLDEEDFKSLRSFSRSLVRSVFPKAKRAMKLGNKQ